MHLLTSVHGLFMRRQKGVAKLSQLSRLFTNSITARSMLALVCVCLKQFCFPDQRHAKLPGIEETLEGSTE